MITDGKRGAMMPESAPRRAPDDRQRRRLIAFKMRALL